jgi:hypothetical protein
VAARGGNLERALRGRLPPDVGEVAAGERCGGEERSGVDRRRLALRLAAEVCDGLGE